MKPVKKKERTLWPKILLGTAAAALLIAGTVGLVYFTRREATLTNKYEQIIQILDNEWYYADQIENLEENFLSYAVNGNAIVVDDPFTQYLNNEQATTLNLKLEGSSAGIGVKYRAAGDEFILTEVFINSPADRAGLRKGDILVEINGIELNGENPETLPEYISQSEQVELVWQRDGQLYEATLVPASFDATVSVDLEDDYGYVKLSSFSNGTGDDFADALKRLQEAGLDTLVLDLRSNTGGTTDAALAVASSLLDQGSVIYQEQYADGSVRPYITRLKYSPVDFENILILQDENTASSSEILIGALRDTLGDEVVTIGQTSYGKGSVQYRFTFNDGTSLKFTGALWLTPSGESINFAGFEPDIVVESAIPSVSYYGDQDVIVDEVNPDAKGLQQMLAYLGYAVDRTDEYFSQASYEALRQFEQDHGLEVDGIGDEETFTVLIEAFGEAISQEMRDFELDAAEQWIAQN